jgi:hypothetical protein
MDALAAVHARGYVHRAVVPANVLIARGASGAASVRLRGFEHCCRADDALQRTTHVGVPGYLAPEQVAGRADLDGRVDVWAVGALAFEALTGVAFSADALAEEFPYERLSRFAPGTPTAFVATVARALHADRDRRFATMGALHDALRAALPADATTATGGAPPPAPRADERFAVLVACSTDPHHRRALEPLAACLGRRLGEEGFCDLSLPPGDWTLGSLLNALARADAVVLLTSPFTSTGLAAGDLNRLASLGHVARAVGVPVVTAPHWDERDAARELALALGANDAFARARDGVGERWRDEPRALVDALLAHLARHGRRDRAALPAPSDFDAPSRALSRSVCALVDPAGDVRGTGFLVAGRTVLSATLTSGTSCAGWRARFVVPLEAGCVCLSFALGEGDAHLSLPQAGAALAELPPAAQLLGNLGRPLPLHHGRPGDRPVTTVAVAFYSSAARRVTVLPGPLVDDPVTGRLTLLGMPDGGELVGAPALAPSGEVVAWVAGSSPGRRAAAPASALLRALRDAHGDLAGRLRATLGISRATPAAARDRAGWHGEAMPPNLARKIDGVPVGLRRYVWCDPSGGEVELAYVPPGEFVRGSNDGFVNERPAHACAISRGYYVGVHPVTVAQFARFVDATGHDAGPAWRARATLHPDHPVATVRWTDAAAYCAWSGLRLLTEAEWEFAARGSTRGTYPWGDLPPDDARACWSGRALRVGPEPVGQRPLGASPFGVHDLAGNVWEWVADWYARYPDDGGLLRDPAGPPGGSTRVIRGGGWRDAEPHSLRAAGRDALGPASSADHVGFRCALSAPERDRG